MNAFALCAVVALAASAGTRRESARLDALKNGLRGIVAKIEAAAADPSQSLSVRDLPNAALGELALGGNPAEAESLLRLLFAQQDMNPSSPGYGTVPWEMRGKTVTDPNAVEFSMQAIGPIFLRYGDKLSPAFRAEAPAHLKAAVEALRRHGVPAAYTNIYLMKTTNLILIGQVLKDPAVVAAGEGMLDAWLALTRTQGIAEYDSPTYYKVDANDLDYGFLYSENPATKKKFHDALDLLWIDIAVNFFPGRGSLSGPHSRDYDFLTGRAGIDAFFSVYGWTPKLKRREGLDAESVALLQSELDGGYRPSPEIYALTQRPERWVAQKWGAEPGQDRTNYLTSDFAIGGASHDFCPYDKTVSIELRSKKPLADISVVVDDTDEPYGKNQLENADGHSKPHHLASRPVTVQSQGLLLATYDAAPDKKRPSEYFATNVLLPLSADELSVNGEPVDVTKAGEVGLDGGSVVSVREGGALALVRVAEATACAGEGAKLLLKIDAAGLKYKAARLIVAHHDPLLGDAPDKCRGRTVILFSAVSADDDAARNAAIDALREAVVTAAIKKNVLDVVAKVGNSTLTISRDLRAKTILKREADGFPAVFGPLTLDGQLPIPGPSRD